MIELKLYAWSFVFIIGLGTWFYSSLQIGIDWERNPRLVDPITGARMDPKEILRLSKILDYSEKYINDTNAEERLHDLVLFSNLENIFLIDQSYTRKLEDLDQSGWPVSNRIKCGYQLEWLLNQLTANRKYTFIKGFLGEQLTTYADSFGRQEAGLYSGMVNWLGSYKQCMRVQIHSENLKTRYCIGRMRPKWWPQNETAYPATTIRLGICLPETCDTLSFNHYKSSIEKLAKLEFTEFYQNGYELVSIFCLPDERSPLRTLPTSGYMFLIVMGAWLLLVVLGTIIYEIRYREKKSAVCAKMLANEDVQVDQSNVNPNKLMTAVDTTSKQQNSFKKLCESLSLRCALKTFKTKAFRVKDASGQRVRVNLGILDCFKSMMTTFVVLGHSGYLNQTFSRSLSNRIETAHNTIGQLPLSIPMFVDVFFLIFGILAAYNMIRKFKPHQLGNPMIWLAVNVRIFIRITPVYFVIYWYSRSISPYTDSGPWWDYGVDRQSIRGQCFDESWWLSIPIFAVFKRIGWPMCVPTAWFLVSYLQIAALLPLIIYIIHKLPNNLCRSMFVGFVATVSSAYTTTQIANMETIPVEAMGRFGTLLPDMLEKFEITGFMKAFGRLGCVCIGCYTGYLLRSYEEGQIAKWPNWLQKRATTLFAAMIAIYLLGLPLITSYSYKNYGTLIDSRGVIALSLVKSIIWPILNAIVFIGFSTTLNHTVISRFCSHTFWYAFNKLGLCIFLIHWEILCVLMSSHEHAAPYGLMRETFRYWFISLFYSTLMSIFLHLVVETPVGKLISYMDDYLTRPKQPTKIDAKQEMYKVEPVSNV